MGCACLTGKKIYSKNIKKPDGEKKATTTKRNYYYTTASHNWVTIVDFLNFKDLKEVMLINRQLNYISRSQTVLSKFYKNKRASVNSENFLKLDKNRFDKINSNNSITINAPIHRSSTATAATLTLNTNDNDTIGSFKELHMRSREQSHRPTLCIKVNCVSVLKKVSREKRSECGSIKKPNIYYEDFNICNTEIIFLNRSLKDTFSDNKTPALNFLKKWKKTIFQVLEKLLINLPMLIFPRKLNDYLLHKAAIKAINIYLSEKSSTMKIFQV